MLDSDGPIFLVSREPVPHPSRIGSHNEGDETREIPREPRARCSPVTALSRHGTHAARALWQGTRRAAIRCDILPVRNAGGRDVTSTEGEDFRSGRGTTDRTRKIESPRTLQRPIDQT
jgi:hypothetical protein